jgi:hypothetical protein
MQALTAFRNVILRFLMLLAAITTLDSTRCQAATAEQTRTIVESANAFLKTLDDSQRSKVSFDFHDAAQRWSNLPVNMAERRGLRMGDLKKTQRDAAMNILSTVLSKMGYEKVVGIVESDEVLRQQSSSGAPPFGRDEFFISFMGKPSTTEPWISRSTSPLRVSKASSRRASSPCNPPGLLLTARPCAPWAAKPTKRWNSSKP